MKNWIIAGALLSVTFLTALVVAGAGYVLLQTKPAKRTVVNSPAPSYKPVNKPKPPAVQNFKRVETVTDNRKKSGVKQQAVKPPTPPENFTITLDDASFDTFIVTPEMNDITIQRAKRIGRDEAAQVLIQEAAAPPAPKVKRPGKEPANDQF